MFERHIRASNDFHRNVFFIGFFKKHNASRTNTKVPPPSPDEKSTTRLMNSAYVTRLRENLKRNSSFGDVYSFLKASKRDGCEGSELYEALRERFGKNELSFCFQVDQFIFLEKMCEQKLVGEPKILNVRRRTGRDGK